jgi:ankyrin repeat protein
MDRSANRSFSLSQPYQPQPQTQTPSNQLTTQNSTENSALSNIANQSKPPRLTQALVSQNTAHGLVDVFGNKDEQEDINIKEFSELKISGYSSSQSIQSPSAKPKLTKEIFSQICSAQSKSDLENCMRIVGVSSLQELCEMRLVETYTVLMAVAQNGNAKLTSLSLQLVADPQKLALMSCDLGLTALMRAANEGHVEVINAILANVPNPQQVAENKPRDNTAMCVAIYFEEAGAITALLSGVPNPQQLAEQVCSNDENALMLAVRFGNVDCVAAVLAGVPNPKALALKITGFIHTSALMIAAIYGHVGVIIKIFEYIDDTEALIFQENFNGNNAFIFALKFRQTEAALVIFDKAKDKASLMFKQNSPDQKAAIQRMKPEILDLFIKKYNESKE